MHFFFSYTNAGYPEETYPVYDDDYDGRPKIGTIMLAEPPQQPTAEALAERMVQEEEEVMARKLSIVREEDEDDEDEEKDGEEEEDEDKEEEVEEIEEEEEEAEAEAERRHLLRLNSSQSAGKQERIGLEVSKELQCYNVGKKQISFSDHRDVFHYPKEETYEEEETEEEDEGTEVEEEEEADEDDPVVEAESLQFTCEGCPNSEEEAEQDNEESLSAGEGDGGIHAEMPKEVRVSGLRMRNRRET